MMMFVMQLEHNYPDNESRNKSQWTLWWIPSRPLITPENINTDYTKNKMHYTYTSSSLIKESCTLKRVDDFQETVPSFFISSNPIDYC